MRIDCRVTRSTVYVIDDFCTRLRVRSRKDPRGVGLLSDALPFGGL
ncbi:MAG TPA: hypothetical protein VGM62_14650 [Chthoniobacterales bacterium]|jgi:hypothetical protein